MPAAVIALCLAATFALAAKPDAPPDADQPPEAQRFFEDIDVRVPHISTDPDVKLDYPIVYVRAQRAGDEVHKRFYTDFSSPVTMQPGADLMLLHPDGREELLVAGGEGSITDPSISFDGEWVYFTHVYNLQKASQWNPPREGADIFKIHVPSRRIVKLTNQRYTPNTGVADWASDYRTAEKGKSYIEYGVYNMGACPLPGGRVAFTSNRDGFKPSNGYPAMALQLFVMDDRDESIGEDEDPTNLEKIGHLNIAGALHPVVLRDGRIMFSSLESQGIRSRISWGIWTIHPDGAMWSPLVSAFDPGGASNGFHFQTQLSDGSIVIEEYYNQNNSGFGAYIKLPESPPEGYAAFGPGDPRSPRNKPWRFGRHYNGKGKWYRKPFMPTGSVSLTPFTLNGEGPADPSVLEDKDSPRVGKFTHPSGAPAGHMLTIYSPGPVNHQYKFLPQLDGGIYLLKDGAVVDQPSKLRLIKNDPKYNESWPRALVPYQRIYGVAEPKQLPAIANDGAASKHLPAGSPYGLIGTSSLYKRESYPQGAVPEGEVTATYAGGADPWRGLDAFTSHGNGMPRNWHNQGGDAGLYDNEQIHAVRILAMEPTTDRHRGDRSGRRFFSHANERLRILGEIPVRKFAGGKQPLDPDGAPDTSFLAKIPADTAFTFQTIDELGMVLNMSQTWHQLRPGEVRRDCGGCHAHSQQPTEFADTRAARDDYQLWDLTKVTPLVADKSQDSSGVKWDADASTGLKNVPAGVANVEYHRDIRPLFARSCVACHTARDGQQPAGNLNLDADDELLDIQYQGKAPGTYYRLAADEKAQFGHKPFGYDSWGYPNASRYIRKMQSRRSLLVWKVYGRRLDGFDNDAHPSPAKPGDRQTLLQKGEPVDSEKFRARWDLDFTGSEMPPPKAVAAGKVKPLSDEDRRMIVRWIDLGCPVDQDYDPEQPAARGVGWLGDDNRPVVALAQPRAGANREMKEVVLGLADYYSGLDIESLAVTADFELDGVPAGDNLAPKFKPAGDGVWRLELKTPLGKLKEGVLDVSIRDRQGNTTHVRRTFSVGE
jgi:hypothetical protein